MDKWKHLEPWAPKVPTGSFRQDAKVLVALAAIAAVLIGAAVGLWIIVSAIRFMWFRPLF